MREGPSETFREREEKRGRERKKERGRERAQERVTDLGGFKACVDGPVDIVIWGERRWVERTWHI